VLFSRLMIEDDLIQAEYSIHDQRLSDDGVIQNKTAEIIFGFHNAVFNI